MIAVQMPELSEPRREAFAREWVSGQSLRTAYAAAGYAPSGGAGRAGRPDLSRTRRFERLW